MHIGLEELYYSYSMSTASFYNLVFNNLKHETIKTSNIQSAHPVKFLNHQLSIWRPNPYLMKTKSYYLEPENFTALLSEQLHPQ